MTAGSAQHPQGLIGHTGFVGSNLDAPDRFTHRYNSTNIGDLAHRHFGRIVCAGVSAAKWVANRYPEADWRNIEGLIDVLGTVSASRFVLISTIDVYPDPSCPWDEAASLDALDNHAYGRHRLALENWTRAHFPACMIVRLPALFGPGLKKNALYDLLHANMVESINRKARFQWYPLKRLWDDMARVEAAGIPLINLFTEPVGMDRIIDRLFPEAPVGPGSDPAPDYRLRTRYASLFGGADGYMLDAASVMRDMAAYVENERAGP